MTERLKQLLDGELGELEIPAPPSHAVLRQGRSLRRRNRVVAGAATVAAAVVVGGSVVALAGGGGTDGAPDPASPTIGGNAVFSYGNQVFYDGPEHGVEIQDKAVKSLFYTSAGVLVRHGDNPYSDGGGEQRFSLVTPDGTVKRLSLATEETVHASDVDQPYVVYAEAVDGDLQVVVYDVTADAEEARVTVGPTRESWFPVSIDGTTVYVSDSSADEVYAVNWAAGTSAPSDSPSAWNVNGGRVGTEVDGNPAVIDAATGDVLLTVDGSGYFNLSPDGRYAELVDEEEESLPESDVELDVYDVGTGSKVTFTGPAWEWGWTPDGDKFNVGDGQVRTCSSATGECTVEELTLPDIGSSEPVPAQTCTTRKLGRHTVEECSVPPTVGPELKLGGRTYES